jgi:hypothetical protein
MAELEALKIAEKLWQAISPSTPVPKSHHARHIFGRS